MKRQRMQGWGQLVPTTLVRADRPRLVSPNGAVPFQPRAKRSDALGWNAKGKAALKGRPIGGAAPGNGSPLQGFDAFPTPTQGGALGWYGAAPLGLNRHGFY